MTAASRYTYLGAAIFAGAAAIAGMLAIAVGFPLRPDAQVGIWLWSVARAGLASGLSAAISFALLSWAGWRLRSRSAFARAALLGTITVIGAHLLVGLVSGLLMMAETVVFLNSSANGADTILIVSFFVSLFSFFWILVTVPLGIATAFLVESLKSRLVANKGDDQVKAAE
jgi:hypothetical protein